MTNDRGTIIAVHLGPGGIPNRTVDRAEVTLDGLAGDAHDHEKHNTPLQAVCLIDVEDLDDLAAEGFAVGPGATGENLTVHGLDVDAVEIGDRLCLSGGVELEVTKFRTPCYVLDAIDPALKQSMRDRAGCYAKVVRTGTVTPGETIERVRAAATP